LASDLQTIWAHDKVGKELHIDTKCEAKEFIMNWDQIAGNWKQMTGKVKEKWGKLTDDDLTVVAGKREQLSGLLQNRYGLAKEQAEKEVDDFVRTFNV